MLTRPRCGASFCPEARTLATLATPTATTFRGSKPATPRASKTPESGLRGELSWLQKNSTIMTTKRARPTLVITDADREAMAAEENQSSYEDSSCNSYGSSSDDDD